MVFFFFFLTLRTERTWERPRRVNECHHFGRWHNTPRDTSPGPPSLDSHRRLVVGRSPGVRLSDVLYLRTVIRWTHSNLHSRRVSLGSRLWRRFRLKSQCRSTLSDSIRYGSKDWASLGLNCLQTKFSPNSTPIQDPIKQCTVAHWLCSSKSEILLWPHPPESNWSSVWEERHRDVRAGTGYCPSPSKKDLDRPSPQKHRMESRMLSTHQL